MKYRIKVLEKAFGILDLFDEKGKEYSAAEIASFKGLNRASTFRILKNLEDANYLEKDANTGKYRLGVKLFFLGARVEPRVELRRLAYPFLRQLVDRFDETVHLAVLERGDALYLEKIEGKKAIQVISRVGMKLPANCSGVGKVLLSGLSDGDLDVLLESHPLDRRTRNTITDPVALKEELERIRNRGYAVDDEEIEEGLKCIAAPVRDGSGSVIAAISLSGPKERLDAIGLKVLSPIVIETANHVSDALEAKDVRSMDTSSAANLNPSA